MSTDLTIRHKEIALLELLDRVLDKGVVVAGDLTISVANIDLIYVGLRLLICSVEKLNQLHLPAAHEGALAANPGGDAAEANAW